MATLDAAMPGNGFFPVGEKVDDVEGGETGTVGAAMILFMASSFGKMDGAIAMADGEGPYVVAKIVSESTETFFGKLGAAVAVSTLFLIF